MAGNPLVLYTSGENDLTEALIKELNSTAPPDFIPPPPTSPYGTGPLPSGTSVRNPLPPNTPEFIGPRIPSPSGTNTRTSPATPAPTGR